MTIGCPDCGVLEELPRYPGRAEVRCFVCRSPLERSAGRSVTAAAAMASATFVLLIPANLAPLIHVSMLGGERSTRLGSGIVQLWQGGWVWLAVLLGLCGLVLPMVRHGTLAVVLGTIALTDRRPPWLGPTFRRSRWLDTWAMTDVFLIGFFIGYTRVNQNLSVEIGWGGYCFVAAAVGAMLTRATLDRRAVWRAMGLPPIAARDKPAISCTSCDYALPLHAEGAPCPRCGSAVYGRKPDAVVRAGALSLAAAILYVPANLYPMTISSHMGITNSHRIIDGVQELFAAGLWPLGILIFCTSIAIPVLKLVGIGWFLWSIRARSRHHLRFKTRLYRAIDAFGRWSNVDVFTIVVFVPLIQFGGLAQAEPGRGATAFVLVVMLTMLASHAFDPRLLWDAAERRRA